MTLVELRFWSTNCLTLVASSLCSCPFPMLTIKDAFRKFKTFLILNSFSAAYHHHLETNHLHPSTHQQQQKDDTPTRGHKKGRTTPNARQLTSSDWPSKRHITHCNLTYCKPTHQPLHFSPLTFSSLHDITRLIKSHPHCNQQLQVILIKHSP